MFLKVKDEEDKEIEISIIRWFWRNKKKSRLKIMRYKSDKVLREVDLADHNWERRDWSKELRG